MLTSNRREGYVRPSQGLAVRIAAARGYLATRLLRATVSQEAMGELIGEWMGGPAITQTVVSNWEKGTTPPAIDQAAAIADVCGVNRAWLLLNEGPAAATSPLAEPLLIDWRERERTPAAEAMRTLRVGENVPKKEEPRRSAKKRRARGA
jgi:helix-turn-helix protein